MAMMVGEFCALTVVILSLTYYHHSHLMAPTINFTACVTLYILNSATPFLWLGCVCVNTTQHEHLLYYTNQCST